MHIVVGSPEASGAAAEGVSANGLQHASQAVGSPAGAEPMDVGPAPAGEPMEVCEEGGHGEWEAPSQQHRARDMLASDRDDSETEDVPAPLPVAAGEALPPEDDEFLEEGVPPLEPSAEDIEDDFWNQ